MLSNVKAVAAMLKDKKRILVLTGAGMSTNSGIPDFRSKTGVYNKNPKLSGEHILSREYFYQKPHDFYDFLKNALYYPDAKPNEGHFILAQWEQEGRVSHIITQNIDGLHGEAGSKNVIEFHGTIQTATCRNKECGKTYFMKELLERDEDDFFYCSCTDDNNRSIIKPDFVLFDETGYWLTGNPFYHVQCFAYDADAILILGTSLQVRPFSTLPEYRNKDTHPPVIIINHDKTPLDNKEHVFVIRDDISKVLKELSILIK